MHRFLKESVKNARKDIVGKRTFEEFMSQFKKSLNDSMIEPYSDEVKENIVSFLESIFAAFPFDGMVTFGKDEDKKYPRIGVTWSSDNSYYLINLSFNRNGSYNLKVHRGISNLSCDIKNSFNKLNVLTELKKYLRKCEIIENCQNIIKNIDDIENIYLDLPECSSCNDIVFDEVVRLNPKVFLIMNDIAWKVYEKENEIYIESFLISDFESNIWVKVRKSNKDFYFDYYKGNVDNYLKYKMLYETERNKYIFVRLLRDGKKIEPGDTTSDYDNWVIKE